MAQRILKAELVHIDETPCVVGVKDGKRTRFRGSSFFWPILADGMVVFHYTGNRPYSVERDIKELSIEVGKISDYRKQYTLPKLNEFLA